MDKIQEIANMNAGRASEAFELAGIENQALKLKIRKLIYYTADDIKKVYEGEGKDGMDKNKSRT